MRINLDVVVGVNVKRNVTLRNDAASRKAACDLVRHSFLFV